MARVINERNQEVLLVYLEETKTTYQRLKGLLGRDCLADGHGISFYTNSIHTFFMKFPIDVVFLDGKGKIRGLVSNLKPWRIVLPVFGATRCIEMPAGTITKSGTRKGDKLRVEA